jgi:hypothetical protein
VARQSKAAVRSHRGGTTLSPQLDGQLGKRGGGVWWGREEVGPSLWFRVTQPRVCHFCGLAVQLEGFLRKPLEAAQKVLKDWAVASGLTPGLAS